MTDIDFQTPTQDERIMAALAHISALLPMMGVIAPIVIWVTQKEKSKYVAYQSIQAVAFQFSMILAWFAGMGCYMCSFFSIFLTIPFADSAESESPLFALGFIIPMLVLGLIMIGGLVFTVYGFIGAVMAFQGKPFRYAIIGSRVERFLQPKPAPEAAAKE